MKIAIRLTSNTRPMHLGSFYLACVMGILLSSFAPQMQPLLLSEFLNLPESEHGTISGNITFWGEIAIILSLGIWGPLSDRWGRRPIMAFGFAIMAVGIWLYPRAEDYQGLLIARLIFAVGIAAYTSMAFTVISDYVHDGDRGKASGWLGVSNGIGAMITVFILLRLPAIFEDQGMSVQDAGILTYNIVAAATLIVAAWMWFGLKRDRHINTDTDSVMTKAKKGLAASKEPGTLLAYGAAFVSRGNLAIVGTFFTLWLANYGSEVAGLSRSEALAQAGMVLGIAQTAVLFGAPFFGVLTDKLNRVTALSITLAISVIGYGGTYFIEDPLSTGMIVCAIFIGLGEVGCIITSGVLIAQQAEPSIRGSVIGFFNICGAIGILVASKVGGHLFDGWTEAGPFVLFAAFAGLVLIWSLIVRVRHPEIGKPGEAAEFA